VPQQPWLPERLYTFAYHEQLIVCKRFSSHFVNQPQRGGLPQVLQKWLKNKELSDSAAAQWGSCLRLIEVEQVTFSARC
jgi:hypothetical protein